MPFPYGKSPAAKDAKADATVAPGAPAFAKKSSKRRRKTGKRAPAQKALTAGRSMSGGGR
jgi:hypothetical protein